MALPYVTGPVAVYVAAGQSEPRPVFLGHGTKAPVVTLRQRYKDIHTDFSGSGEPFDAALDSTSALVKVELVRYNENVLAAIQSYGNTTNTGVRGIMQPGEIGSLVGIDRIAYPLWLVFPYALKAVFNAVVGGLPRPNAIPPGLRFPLAFLDMGDELEQGSSQPRKIRLTWRCLRKLDTTQSNAFGRGALLLYDTNVNGLPPID